MPLSAREIAKRFTKAQLLGVAEELEMKVKPSTSAVALAAAIENDLDTNGIVEDAEVSDELFDIMVAFGFIDENGNILGEEGEEEPEEEEEEEPEPEEEIEIPGCFGYGDVDDPNCKRCPLSAKCVAATKVNCANQPCWAEYEDDAQECQLCVLWRLCKAASK